MLKDRHTEASRLRACALGGGIGAGERTTNEQGRKIALHDCFSGCSGLSIVENQRASGSYDEGSRVNGG